MYAAAGRAFRGTNLRPVVIGFTVAALIWSLIWYVGQALVNAQMSLTLDRSS